VEVVEVDSEGEEEMEADQALEVAEEVLVETEVLSLCTKLLVTNVTNLAKFLFVQQKESQFTVMNALEERKNLETEEEIDSQERVSMLEDQREMISLLAQTEEVMMA
jgi:hypothetical protein